MKIRLGLALALAALALPATAGAQVTTSDVTSPADRSYFLDDDNAASPAELTVTGTSDGDAADTVTVICTFDGGAFTTLAPGVPVAANGSFSATGELDDIDPNTCVLRAVDSADVGRSAAYHRYTGPRVAVSKLGEFVTVPDGPNAGKVYDWSGSAQGLGGIFELRSAGNDGIDSAHAYHPRTWEDASNSWDRVGDVGGLAEAGSGSRRLLLVDGRNALTAEDAATWFGDGDGGDPDSDELPGLPGITLTAQVDGPLTTFRESSQLVRCPTDEADPTAATCAQWVATGVRLDRTWTVREGQVASVSDVFTSTDGAAHTVDPISVSDIATSELGYRLPGTDHFEHLEGGVVLGASELGDGPFYFTALEVDDDPDGPENAQVGVVYPDPPAQLRWSADDVWESAWGSVAVPAGGSSAPLRQDVLHGVHSAQVRALTLAQADGYEAPDLSIAFPADGETVFTDNVVIAGVASDVQMSSVTVNGRPASLGADGGWWTVVGLALGENLLTATATDGAGNTTQVSRELTYVEPVRERVSPAGITREVTPGRDRSAPFKFRVNGSIVLPREIAASQGCDGNVLVTVRAGRKILAVKSPPVLGNCTFKSGRFKFRKRKQLGRGRKALKVGVRFTGNQVLKGKTATKATFRVR